MLTVICVYVCVAEMMGASIALCCMLVFIAMHNVICREVVNVGGMMSFEGVIGKVAKHAMEMAVLDVNSNLSLLYETQLNITFMNTNCSAFIGTATGFDLFKQELVAVASPESSEIAHTISFIANELKVPLLSYGATDPSLSTKQYPYFLQVAHNDLVVMSAISSVIGFYGWKQVIAVFSDDNYGRNGIGALDDMFVAEKMNIVRKVGIPLRCTKNHIKRILLDLAIMQAKIFVVHLSPDSGLNFFAEVKNLGMMSGGYVWIATDWLTTVLDTKDFDTDVMSSLQGVITLRRYSPKSERLHDLLKRWHKQKKLGHIDVNVNVFGLYAYDTIWKIAHALDALQKIRNSANFTFSTRQSLGKTTLDLNMLKILKEGPEMLKTLQKLSFTGVTGPVKLDDKDSVGTAFQIINIIGTGFRTVSYWSKSATLSVTAPDSSHPKSIAKQELDKKIHDIIWPGNTHNVPRGWGFQQNSKQLIIGVPRETVFNQFASVSDSGDVKGFCIDVFVAALKMLPYVVPYRFLPFGSGKSSPSHDELLQQVALKNFDAAVGDITILSSRSKLVDFTQPYVESGLVIVAPLKKIKSDTWAFMQPFTTELWLTTGLLFLFIGAVVWFLEHRLNPQFRGEPRQQLVTILWFSFSTLYFAHRENVVSTLGRIVLIIWLFVVLIISSSYTASLTSMLTLRKLSPTINGIDDLISSNMPIGYQRGSYIADYLVKEFKVPRSRFIALDNQESYTAALSKGPTRGGVGAIIDELPHMQMFLSAHCGFTIVGNTFTKDGWGFVFQKDSPLAEDITTAILNLSANGELQRIYDQWMANNICYPENNENEPSQIGLSSFWGLFLLSGGSALVALIAFLCRVFCKFMQEKPESKQVSALKRLKTIIDRKASNENRGSKRARTEVPDLEHQQTEISPM